MEDQRPVVVMAVVVFLYWWNTRQRDGRGQGRTTGSLTADEKRQLQEKRIMAAVSQTKPKKHGQDSNSERSSGREAVQSVNRRRIEPVKPADSVTPTLMASKKAASAAKSRKSGSLQKSQNDKTSMLNKDARRGGQEVSEVPVGRDGSTTRTPAVETSSRKESPTKKPKRKIRYPPVQIFCEALSVVLKQQVTVEAVADAGTWGRQDWKRRTTAQRSSTAYRTEALLTLPLYHYQPPTETDDWTHLTEILEEFLESKHNPIRLEKNNVRVAAQWFSRTRGIIRNGFHPHLADGEVGHLELRRCMEILEGWIIGQVASWLQKDVHDACEAGFDEETDEETDLFDDDYNKTGGSSTVTLEADCKGPLNKLLFLLEEADPVISRPFMAELMTDEKPHGLTLLPSILLRRILCRLNNSLKSKAFSSGLLLRQLSALSQILSVSPDACRELAKRLGGEVSLMQGVNGRGIENLVWLQPLFSASAYVVPAAGAEAVETSRNKGAFHQQLDGLENFPICAFKLSNAALPKIQEESRHSMRVARGVAESALRAAFATPEKERVFSWLGEIILSNEPRVKLLKDELLSADGAVATLSTRAFLLGITSVLTSFCCHSLTDRYNKMGTDAFDARYLAILGGRGLTENDRSMVPREACNGSTSRDGYQNVKFSGGTKFFFLTSAMLRVSLYPVLRMEGEFHHVYHKLLAAVQGVAASPDQPNPSLLRVAGPVVSAWLGWKTFLLEKDFANAITDFCILQLQWLLSVVRGRSEGLLLMIPEWMCKEPARWLTHIARTSSHLLSPHQAERAVETAAELLRFGSTTEGSGRENLVFSPIVLSELIRIVSAFVQAGVHRAKRRKRLRHRAPPGQEMDSDDDTNIYLSFDQNDLGVTVFTNRLVCTELCPTLIQTFLSLDFIEGLDTDRESGFDKFGVKAEIAELLLRLWSHPNGECRKSVTSIVSSNMVRFASSLSAALSVSLDNACEKLTNVAKWSKAQTRTAHETRLIGAHSEYAAGGFLGARRQLRLLCMLSQDERIASSLGGHGDAGANPASLSALVNLVVHFLDVLTLTDGGTNPDFEFSLLEPTSAMMKRQHQMSVTEKNRLAKDVVHNRMTCRSEFGLDVSILCHQLLALASRWHLVALKKMESESRRTPILASLAAHEDCELDRFQNVLTRLVETPGPLQGTELDNATAIFKHDGYVDCTNWIGQYEQSDMSQARKSLRRTAGKGHMSRIDISKIASNVDISKFIEDLRQEKERVTAEQRGRVKMSDISGLETTIMDAAGSVTEEEYGENLSEWVISSSPFVNPSSSKRSFSHFYDNVARSRGASASGKTLVKEARRCRNALPTPHANTSIFLCFAEERMDLCRGVLTGPVDTPYAFGIFVFDVFFPALYPQIPPLVTFMTTGGGQVHFNPNLYVDGKVCLSLLGVATAGDMSQRWNPNESSLAQILVSLQTQVFTKDPFFNEGGGVAPGLKNSKMGQERSTQYNNTLRLATLRYAINAHLRSPPLGFEEVTLRHFSMCRKRLVAQASTWVMESKDTPLFARFQRAYAELLYLLSSKELQPYASLPPASKAMKKMHRAFPKSSTCTVPTSSNEHSEDQEDSKPKAIPNRRQAQSMMDNEVVASGVDGEYNPWAAGNLQQQRQAPQKTEPEEENDSDDDDIYS